MVLSRKALREFESRKLRDSGRTKQLNDRELDQNLEHNRLVFHTAPRRAQKICLLLGMRYPRYLFLMGCGGGKTKICIDIFVNRWELRQAERCLVVVPNVVNLREWVVEVARHSQGFRAIAIDQSGEEAKLAAIANPDYDFVVITYHSLGQLCSKAEPRKDGKRNRWAVNVARSDRIAKHFQMLVLDECTSIKGGNGLHYFAARRMRNAMSYCYGLTGTPFDKDPSDLWAQFFLIDGGHALGETLGLFRAAFFSKQEGYWATTWEFKKRRMPELSRRLAHCSIRFSESECQDLPPAVGGINDEDFMLLKAQLPKATLPYYNLVKKEYSDSRGSYELMRNAYTRMRMVSSGWLGAVDEEGEKVEVVFSSNPKLDAVVAKLRELDPDEKVVVVHWFNTTGKLVTERLKKEKIPAVWVYGGTTSARKREAIDRFNAPGGPRVLVGSTAISKGVNLQFRCRYMIFLEAPNSAIDRRQLEARIRREGGSGGTCYYYDAVCVGTKDETILEGLKEGKNLSDIIVDGVRKPRRSRSRMVR